MEPFVTLDAARLASLASGRGGAPLPHEWPLVALMIGFVALLGTRVLLTVGLSRVEALLVGALSPLLVLVDAPLGQLAPRVALAANVTGCIIPCAIGLKILLERRSLWTEALLLVAVGIAAAYFSSHVEPDRGVLLQYRVPAIVVGILSAGLLHKEPARAGAVAFAAGAVGVVIGADALRLPDLAASAAGGRVVLGGAGLLDGILLVAVLAACVGELLALTLRALVRTRVPSEPTI